VNVLVSLVSARSALSFWFRFSAQRYRRDASIAQIWTAAIYAASMVSISLSGLMILMKEMGHVRQGGVILWVA
jgi:hypothetical protein